MVDYVIMGGILAFLVFILVFGSRYIPEGNNGFFDQQNTKAMRGFWSLIVVLVHIPQQYCNPIQDMIGSFAYIGVTFFFMTSAYGLSLGIHKKPASIKRFWLTRLPKLLIPNWVNNIIFSLILLGFSSSFSNFFGVNPWIKSLIVCYIAFWIGHRFNWNKKLCKPITGVLVIAFSISFYCMRYTGMTQSAAWCTEAIGFIWGMVLFSRMDAIKAFFLRKWVSKSILACLLSLILGISYLAFKYITFWGDYVLKIALGLSILSFILILNRKIKIGNKISWLLGDISFEVYLIHDSVFTLVQKLFPDLSSGVFIIASMSLTVLFAIIVHKICSVLINCYTPLIKRV